VSDKLVGWLRLWSQERGRLGEDAKLLLDAADRIEELERALREVASQRLLYAAEHWCMEECRICALNAQINALLSAAPEPQ
jgi:hypothetical protein